MVSVDIGKGNLWDVAAGTYLCRTAGVQLMNAYGERFDENKAKDGIVALQPRYAQEILAYKPFLEKPLRLIVSGLPPAGPSTPGGSPRT
jgi:hypothetical protein